MVITYCASQSPHDQYYFRDPVRMVHGQVNAPTLDLANLELVKSHMHALFELFDVPQMPQNRKRAELVRRAFERGAVTV